MKITINLCAFLSLAYALLLPRKSHLVSRSSTLGDATPLETDELDLSASNTGFLTSPELLPGLGDASDITSMGTDNSAVLTDFLASSSGPLDPFDGSSNLNSIGVADSTQHLCPNDCPYSDTSIPLGLDPGDGSNFGADPSSGGMFIPPDEQVAPYPGSWLEVHRGSGRREYLGLTALAPEESEKRRFRQGNIR